MKRALLASAALLGMASHGYCLTLPPTYAPAPSSFVTNDFSQGVTGSISGVRRSPFDTTTTPNAPYDVVYGNSNSYGIGATFDPAKFSGSNAASGTFKFVDGSPDSYNVLVFNLVNGMTRVFQGDQIAVPTNGMGVQIVNLTGIGAYKSVGFGSENTNAFEFAALSSVPLPASAPMFGAALVVVAAVGYGVKRKRAPAATA